MGWKQKKVDLFHNDLKTSEINFNKDSIGLQIEAAVENFLNQNGHFEVHTSGSTGQPKKIRIRKDYMKVSAQKTLDFLGLKEGDTALLCLPVDKIAGIMMVVRALVGGLRLFAVEPSAKPLRQVEGEYDFGAMVPYQVQSSLAEIPRVKNLIIGGAAVDLSMEKELAGMSNTIYHTYGMTETISHVAMRRIQGPHGSAVYQAMSGVGFAMDDRGCLVIDAPEIGVEALATNDVVDLKDDQSFIWKGRFDNVVNSGGVKLHPEIIEGKIGPLGFGYFLIGIPDSRLGEKLVMVAESEVPIGFADIEAALSVLDPYERPKKIFTVREMERTANGKLRREASLRKAMRN